MAHAANTTLPMFPVVNPYGSQAAIPTWHGTAAATTIVKGDVLVYSTEDLNTNNAATTGIVVGVAHDPGTIDAVGDVIAYTPALPGICFEASGVEGANDATGDEATDIGVIYDLIQDDFGNGCVDLSATTQTIALVLSYGRQMNATQDAQPFGTASSGHGVTNPRLVITFVDTVFQG